MSFFSNLFYSSTDENILKYYRYNKKLDKFGGYWFCFLGLLFMGFILYDQGLFCPNSYGFLILGLFFFVIGFFHIKKLKKRDGEISNLQQSGKKIKASFIDFSYSWRIHFGSKNTPSWVLKVKDGVKEYESDAVAFRRADLKKKLYHPIDVYIDICDPNNYWVDVESLFYPENNGGFEQGGKNILKDGNKDGDVDLMGNSCNSGALLDNQSVVARDRGFFGF